jgi:hypothetical protein
VRVYQFRHIRRAGRRRRYRSTPARGWAGGSGSLRRRFAPLSSRGLGRRPLTAETRVRIPVAVLVQPSNGALIARNWRVRHSVCHSRAGEIRAQMVRGLTLRAGDDVAVAVQRDSDTAVSGPGRDLLEIEARGDEGRDRTVARLMQRDRLDAAPFHAFSAAARSVDGNAGSRAVRPNTRSSPSRPERSFSSRSSRRTGNAIGTPRTPADDFAAIAPAYKSHPRSTRLTPGSKSTSVHRSANSSPRRSPANMATVHSGRWSAGRASRICCAFAGVSIRSRRPRTARASGDRWVAHWRDLDGVQHKQRRRAARRLGVMDRRGARQSRTRPWVAPERAAFDLVLTASGRPYRLYVCGDRMGDNDCAPDALVPY